MPNFIGIDLGTSTTLMARLNEAGQAEIVRNDEGDNLTHSAVWFETADKAVIGKEAKRMLGLVDGSRIFVEYKRDMHDNSVSHEIDGKKWTPRDFSALVLKKLRVHLDATGMRPDAVIITIPANFMDEARVNTLLAAEEAGLGLKDDALINEPTAAALYYVTRASQQIQGRCLVYDFGGGTFDATILEVRGEDIQVKTSVGVQHLGGKDMDEKLMAIIADKFTKATGKPFDAKELAITKWDIEQNYKHPLSIRDKVSIAIRGETTVTRFDITRSEFDEAISSLIAQANMAVESALDRAGLKPSDINHVFLAGGATRVPAVTTSIEKLIGKKPFSDNPDEAVAKGAAIYAGIRNKDKMSPGQKEVLGTKKVTDVTPHFYGTITFRSSIGRNVNSNIIDKDLPLPCSKTQTFYRTPQNGNRLHIEITQSAESTEDPDLVNVVIADWWEKLPMVSEPSEIVVTYSYDTNGIVKCKFLDKASGMIFERDITRDQKDDGQGHGEDDETGVSSTSKPPKGPGKAGNIDDILL